MVDRPDESATADIIPFPQRPPPPLDPAARLDRAMRALNEANGQLQDAISDWRRVNDALTVNLDELRQSLQVLDSKLVS